MPSLPVALNPGTRLGPHEIATRIGKGGIGEVHRALDTNLGDRSPSKSCLTPLPTTPSGWARFEREAKTLASLNHSNIAQIYGFEKTGATRALVMALVEGETLADRLTRDGAPAFADAIRVAIQVAAALDAAHQKGIVHRDLKPANIGLTSDGAVKLLDFGLAKTAAPAVSPEAATAELESMTQAGVVVGTLPYMSPEQLQGKPVDQRADIWAFGAIVYELLTGRRLFRGDSGAAIMAAVLTRPIDLDAVPASGAQAAAYRVVLNWEGMSER